MKLIKNSRKDSQDQGKDDLADFLKLLEDVKKKDPEMKFAYAMDTELDSKEEGPKLDRMLIQTSMMQKYYARYSDVVFMDATYKTNKHDLALTLMSGVSSEGKNIILAIAFMSRETSCHYTWLLQTLLEFNNGKEPDTIITDFDSSMCQAIEKTFKNTTHLLCQWHMQNNFKKHFVFLNKKKVSSGRLLYNHIIDCIFTESPKRF